jgi:hypothetical protein
MGDMLRSMTFSGSNWLTDKQRALDTVAWAVCTTINLSIKHLSCHLAFNHDMIFHFAVAINWDNMNKECQQLVIASNPKEKKSRLEKHYSP